MARTARETGAEVYPDEKYVQDLIELLMGDLRAAIHR
jgi:hypothetical protein